VTTNEKTLSDLDLAFSLNSIQAGVRGERALNAGPPSRFYWEVNVGDRIFGTSMMFGIGTKKSPLHIDSFVNMIGCDDQGWGLSHKGLLFHNDHWIEFTQHFVENKGTTIGLLFDGMEGTLSYFKDGIPLGVAFTGLNLVKDKLYPMVSSTAAKTQVTLQNMQRDFINLRDRYAPHYLTSLFHRDLNFGRDVSTEGHSPQFFLFLVQMSTNYSGFTSR
jgi:hypothetical protein